MKSIVGLLFGCAAVLAAVVLVWRSGGQPVPETGPTPVTNPQATNVERAAPMVSSPAELAVEPSRRESVSTPMEETDDTAPAAVVEATTTTILGVLDPNVAQLLGDQRARIVALEAEIDRLRAELDECRDGPYSVLGTLHALPEWTDMDKPQRAIVLDFLRRFPVRLNVGEATMIATHASPTGDTTREIISMLGRARVLQSMTAEAREKFIKEDPDEFQEYFGPLANR